MMLHLCVPAGDGMDPALVALLAAAGKSASSLPADMAAALTKGKVRDRPAGSTEATAAKRGLVVVTA
jgi:hypothetical protein